MDGPVMVPSMYELTSAGLKGKKLVGLDVILENLQCCVFYHGASSRLTSVLSSSL